MPTLEDIDRKVDKIGTELHEHIIRHSIKIEPELEKVEREYEKINQVMFDMRDKETVAVREATEQIIKIVKDLDWLKKFFWIIATASVGGLIAQLLSLATIFGK